jgi:6-phosphogluconate dehydrogenase
MKAGLVGLGVMGRNLVLNLRDKGHEIVATDSWESARSWSPPGVVVAADHAALVAALETPRIVWLMVKAGEQVDNEIATLLPHLSAGDTIIDGGNSFYRDTERRCAELAERGIGFLGVGISGGAEGARNGAAMMVGGDRAVWAGAEPLLSSVAAPYGSGPPTIDYFGEGGAGHFVKMVHNGIEYAIMEAIAECHGLMRGPIGLTADDIADTFERWNGGEAAGFLVEITTEILRTTDAATGDRLLDHVDDAAGQKGTGGWTVNAALEYGVAAPAIFEAVCMRQLSGSTAIRQSMRKAMPRSPASVADRNLVSDLEHALVATMMASLAQGVGIYAAAAQEHAWGVRLPAVLRVWRAGSILRMRMLEELARAVEAVPEAEHLLTVPAIAARLVERLADWRRAVGAAIDTGCPVPVLAAALAYAEGLATTPLPTVLVQAQRDRFGAHGFRRTDRDGTHHGPWVRPDLEAGT